ncbi:hypothetical protein JTE90_021087 [Oedothorax gibbosus]|uniref:Secreted protein n=1 Tax=Oedothorax gibbosus TaxID=931172 RepID=A0AAV6VQI3_9ARAC|nr:hypothetical protein JTE90_021087 [Oedothorax gibbosus]
MCLLTSVLLLSLGVLCSATEDDVCKERRPTHCFADVPDGPLDFPDSEEALDKICPILLPRIKCVLDYKKKCPDTVLDGSGLDENLDDIYVLFVEACDKDSDLNKGLSTHLPCIEKNIQGHVAACEPMVKEVLEEMTSHLNLNWDSEDVFPTDEDRHKYICTKEALDMSCFVASTSVKCGEEAGEISGSIIERVGVLDVLCPENIRDDVKALVALVQPLMELGVAADEMVSKIK